MKLIKLQLLLVLLTLFLTTSCEKDESTTPSVNIFGTYSFRANENVIVKKWKTNGVEVIPSNVEIDSMVALGSFFSAKLNFTLTSDYKIIVFDSLSMQSDTGVYKFKSNNILIGINENPKNDSDYFPLFAYKNNELYTYNSVFEYSSNTNGSSAIARLHLDAGYSILDTGLKLINYQNVSQLKEGEQIITCNFNVYYTKK